MKELLQNEHNLFEGQPDEAMEKYGYLMQFYKASPKRKVHGLRTALDE